MSIITVTVTHGPGDSPADAIADPLINTDAVARARGHAELDQNGPSKKRIAATGPYTGWLQPGTAVTLREQDTGDRTGILDSFSLHGQVTGDAVTADVSMEIECLDA